MSKIMHLLDASRQGIIVRDYGGHEVSYIRVPRSSSDRCFNNTKSWIDEALQTSWSPHNGTLESAFCVANHMCRFYKDSVDKALNKQGIVIAQEMTVVK